MKYFNLIMVITIITSSVMSYIFWKRGVEWSNLRSGEVYGDITERIRIPDSEDVIFIVNDKEYRCDSNIKNLAFQKNYKDIVLSYKETIIENEVVRVGTAIGAFETSNNP